MGANTSALLSEEIEEISRQTNLQQSEVKRLYKRFQQLDRKQSGTLDTRNLLMVPELAMNPLHPRLVSMFENVNFQQFVTNIGAFSSGAQPSTKIDFTFRLYDVDEDGFISSDDLEKILRMLVGDHIDQRTLTDVAVKVIADADTDGDGRISRDEFTTALDVPEVARKLTVTF
ncbi:Calcineurin subunit B [Gracilariopsis chorda]|uniref:Calcineurin subunit B n=1 Tax=Gracilariopsis chorda TaxID=448386 RepID=A0A2V3IHG8_9FLOR|nr:Calcineurin subunit B [Gracilariopsis chorda]|eukprot:PXF41556.1 Calcineurin subunit B [Gracilariopsis chorda]